MVTAASCARSLRKRPSKRVSTCKRRFVQSCEPAIGNSKTRYDRTPGTPSTGPVTARPVPVERSASGTMQAAAATQPTVVPRTPEAPRDEKA
jgi:hypothetical protein